MTFMVEIDLSNTSLLSQATGQTGEVRCLQYARTYCPQCPTINSTLIVYIAPPAIGPQRGDGSAPRFIAASPPDVSDQKVDEQGRNIHSLSAQRVHHSNIDSGLTSRLAETRTLNSIASSELRGTSKGNHLHPVLPATITSTPIEGDTYTRPCAFRRRL